MSGRVIIVLAAALFAACSTSGERRTLETREQKLSYAFGMEAGNNLRSYSLNVDPELLLRGLEDALAGGETLLTEAEVRTLIADLRRELSRKATDADVRRAADELAGRNRKASEAFLAENSREPDVIVLDSGLQYRVLREGEGPKPSADDAVMVHYRGMLVDGTEFDSSYRRGQPATFRVDGVIKGWAEALQRMPTGSRWQIVIPPELAYGARGAGQTIGPESALVFEVELLAIVGGADGGREAVTAAISDIRFSYKLDSRLMGGLYLGDRWISPPTYTGLVGQDTVSVRVLGIDGAGRPVAITPKWSASDPGMVVVTPGEGSEVAITVKRAGQSTVQIAVEGFSEELEVKAEQRDDGFKVEVGQTS
jgi:FKBP-type peptidyl-prolyl cis-trans isomerase FklB